MENLSLVLALLVLSLVLVGLAALFFGPAGVAAGGRRAERRSDWW